MCLPMSDERPPDVLSALPRTRPHRRSDKRAANGGGAAEAGAAETGAAETGAAETGAPETAAPRPRKPAPATRADIVGTAFQAAGELAEIGLSAGARAVRRVLSRPPRP